MADSACCERREATPASLEGPAPAARPPADRPHRVAVLGVGNDLVGDDGVGVAVLKALQGAGLERRFPGVVLVDAGTAAFDAVALLQETVKRLVIVDAVRAGGEPGCFYRFPLEALHGSAEPGRLSLHQVTLLEALHLAELSGRRFDEVVMIGVEPAETAWGMGLSETLRNRMEALADLVSHEVARMTAGSSEAPPDRLLSGEATSTRTAAPVRRKNRNTTEDPS